MNNKTIHFLLAFLVVVLSCTKVVEDETSSNKSSKANFTVSTDTINPNDTVYFTDISDCEGRVWKWYFGDGTISYDQNPFHSYSSTRRYSVTLEVSDNYGKYELTKSNCVVVVAPDSIVEPEDTSTFVDSRDGKVYHWVKIGEQTWMQENLAYDGIPGCWAYHNDIDNVTIYGYLYTWNAAMNAAPEGWHIPTKEEWEELAAYLGEEAGSKLAGNSALWENSALTESTNFGMSNFNGLPSGYRKDNGDYVNQAYETLWWSATEKNLYGSYFLSLFYTNTYLGIGYMDKTYAYSVRCIKDIE